VDVISAFRLWDKSAKERACDKPLHLWMRVEREEEQKRYLD
jgi:hypothetical protein